MHTRKNAALLTDAERDAFLAAVLEIKHTQAPNAPQGVSVYDRFVATHAAVMQIRVPTWPEAINMGHWNIGFLPWHREYLRRFELALQAVVPEARIPYWDWADHAQSQAKVFTDEFMGPLRGTPLSRGWFQLDVPAGERPGWWPAGASGWPLRVTRSNATRAMQRLNPSVGGPPTSAELQNLVTLTRRLSPDFNTYWIVWQGIEAGLGFQGYPSFTHNWGHNVIGGDMSDPMFSPNDPMFWLHHANVDRVWSVWQANMLAQHGGQPADHYPLATELSPWNNQPAPPGHRIDDEMWPWVTDPAGYTTTSFDGMSHRDRLLSSLLPVGGPAVTPRHVLDVASLGYTYEPPGGP